MSTELVPLTLQVPKELNDVRVALVGIVDDIKAGKTAGEIAGENLPALFAAIDNAGKIPEEAKEKIRESCALGGLMGGELLGVLLAPKAVTVPG